MGKWENGKGERRVWGFGFWYENFGFGFRFRYEKTGPMCGGANL
jgi:hypothetical protein